MFEMLMQGSVEIRTGDSLNSFLELIQRQHCVNLFNNHIDQKHWILSKNSM